MRRPLSEEEDAGCFARLRGVAYRISDHAGPASIEKYTARRVAEAFFQAQGGEASHPSSLSVVPRYRSVPDRAAERVGQEGPRVVMGSHCRQAWAHSPDLLLDAAGWGHSRDDRA